MASDKVSVIMSVYNEEIGILREAIESILNQSYKNIQFIISSNKAVTKINPTNCFHVLSLLSFFIITLLTIKYLQSRAQRY